MSMKNIGIHTKELLSMKNKLVIRLPDDLLMSLEIISKEYGMKKSELVRSILQQFRFRVGIERGEIESEETAPGEHNHFYANEL